MSAPVLAAAAPQRIQLRRTKGYRKPVGAVVVSRPSMWGNPFTIADCLAQDYAETVDDAQRACADIFRHWLSGDPDWSPAAFEGQRARILDNLWRLHGCDLACWCKVDRPCHGDTLILWANGGGGTWYARHLASVGAR